MTVADEKTFVQRVEELNAAKRDTPPAAATNVTTIKDNSVTDPQRYAQAVLTTLRATTKGTRNEALRDSARALAQLPLDRNWLRNELIEACRTNGHLPEDGLDMVEGTIRSAFTYTDTKLAPRPIRPPRTNGNNITEVAATAFTTQGEKPLPFIDGAAFILDIPDTIPALWGTGDDVLWAEGESLMIAGPMGLGKTTLAGQLIKAQLGIDDSTVLGLPVPPQRGRILYLAMDRPAQIARAMARQFWPQHRDTLTRQLIIWKGPPPADIAKNPGLLAYLAEQADADVVYLDSVKDAAVGLSEDEVGAGYNRARQQLLADGRQLAELHHTTKRGAQGGAPDHVADIYGSAWIVNGTGSIILLTGEPGDPIVGFKHPRQPVNEYGPLQLLHDQAAGRMSIHHSADLVDLARACGPEGLTAKAAAATLFDTTKPSRAQQEKARRRLDKLTEAGQLQKHVGASGGSDGGSVTTWYPAIRGTP